MMRYFGKSILVAMVILVSALGWATEATWRRAEPGYTWSFPRDLAAHPPYKTEWWYITGYLASVDDPDSEPLGFQLTFFRSGIAPADSSQGQSAWQPEDLVMAHAALTDPATKKHIFSEVIWRTTPFLGGFAKPGESLLAWCRAPAGTDANWELEWRNNAYYLTVKDDARQLHYELRCEPTRPTVFHGKNGYSPKTADGKNGSLYFSQTRMATTGTVYLDGKPVQVQGRSWLDREIFTSTLAGNQKGWDWPALSLDQGQDLMLYSLRDQEGRIDFALGTWVDEEGQSSTLPADDWEMVALDFWDSEATGSRYPVSWRLRVPGQNIDIKVQAVIPNQENVSGQTGIHYWEGAVTLHDWERPDQLRGRGFVELTGYGEGSRPPI